MSRVKQPRQLTVVMFSEMRLGPRDQRIEAVTAALNTGRSDQHSRLDEPSRKLVVELGRRMRRNQLAKDANLMAAHPERIVHAAAGVLHPKQWKVRKEAIPEACSLQQRKRNGRTDLKMKRRVDDPIPIGDNLRGFQFVQETGVAHG